eukprot:gnl/MRDRNA2_/MRDRNA2_80738_c0_seq1.p1 gnl/MRDRNA2_/MRDRNA2_80738_c0~~gnl/MRDRNA2_/MRDRNA2_80738_c0_seq1.p1  ORF type:complete len:258 (-),score=53.66 gnl/MRDRNA2_/MRDRNA2_80738_c0_seq1:33-779(-)
MVSLCGEYGMHLGGLVLALALWRTSKHKQTNPTFHQTGNESQPKVVVLGGGGGVIPRTIAAALPGSSIDVVEPCADTRLAARTWFGLAELEDGAGNFRLHGGCGAEFLSTVAENSVDVLIVDAASGQDGGLHAPPPAFRTDSFWKAATYAMNQDSAAFGLNLVGREEATAQVQQTVAQAMGGWSLRSMSPPPGGLPDSIQLDQRLLFGSIGNLANQAELRKVGLSGLEGRLMKDEELWLQHWDKHPNL